MKPQTSHPPIAPNSEGNVQRPSKLTIDRFPIFYQKGNLPALTPCHTIEMQSSVEVSRDDHWRIARHVTDGSDHVPCHITYHQWSFQANANEREISAQQTPNHLYHVKRQNWVITRPNHLKKSASKDCPGFSWQFVGRKCEYQLLGPSSQSRAKELQFTVSEAHVIMICEMLLYNIHEGWWSLYPGAAWFHYNLSLCTPFKAFIIRFGNSCKAWKACYDQIIINQHKSYVCQDSSHRDISHLRCKHGCPRCGRTSAYWNARRTCQSTHPEIVGTAGDAAIRLQRVMAHKLSCNVHCWEIKWPTMFKIKVVQWCLTYGLKHINVHSQLFPQTVVWLILVTQIWCNLDIWDIVLSPSHA